MAAKQRISLFIDDQDKIEQQLQTTIQLQVVTPTETSPSAIQLSPTSNDSQTIPEILSPGDKIMTRDEVPPCPTYLYVLYYSIVIGSIFIIGLSSVFYLDNYEDYVTDMISTILIAPIFGWFIGAIFYNLCGLPSNYTRKIGHFIAFVLPLLFAGGVNAFRHNAAFNVNDAFNNVIYVVLWSALDSQILIILMTQPMRKLSNHLCGDTRSKRPLRWINCCENTMDAFERTEDRPNHLLWLNTQFVLFWLFMLLLSFWWNNLESGVQILIPAFISGLGDGLAEVVGVKFGKNCFGKDCTYTVYGCCTIHHYVRSEPLICRCYYLAM